MVGLGGLEPPTSRLSSARSNQLSYKPEPEDRSQRTEDRMMFCPLSSVLRRPAKARPLEERETKTAASRKDGLTGRLILRFPVERPEKGAS